MDIFFFIFFLKHRDRKHYYIKVVESIQFVCAGNSGISRVLCNANTYRSIHEGLFFNSSPALDLEIPLETPLNNSQYILSTYNSQHNNNNNNVVLAMTMPYSGQGIVIANTTLLYKYNTVNIS